jgi:hypothetical protein
MHELHHVIGPKFRMGHGEMAEGRDRSRLHQVLTVLYLRHEVLQDMEFIRIELVVREVERKDLRLDRAEARFRPMKLGTPRLSLAIAC